MTAELEPPELAHLVDYAERPRVGDWSLRGALVRYAQGQPRRVSQVLEHVRRIEHALHPEMRQLARHGQELWAAVASGERPRDPDLVSLAELLGVMTVLDEVAEELAQWAEDPRRPRPDDAVDAAVTEAAGRLDELGVESEAERPRGPRSRRP